MNIFGLIFWFCILFIAYVYAGYPLLVAVLGRLRRKAEVYPEATPKISILIAAYNEQDVIASKLENTLCLDYPADCMQIVVAVDGSDDRTAEIVESFADRGVELSYDVRRRGKTVAINRAVPRLKHDIVVFSDANNMYAPDSLKELVKPFVDPQVGGVTGSKNIVEDTDAHARADGLYWKYESFIKKSETRLGSCTGVVGEILAIRRSLYQAPPAHVINDDFFIGMAVLRQGYRLIYAPRAHSEEHSSLTERDEAIRRSRIVAGRYQAMLMAGSLLPWRNPVLVWQIFSHKFMRPLVPLVMILAFAVTIGACIWPPSASAWNAWLYLAWPYNFVFLCGEILVALLSLMGGSLKEMGFLGKLLYIPTFLVNSNMAAIFGLYSFLTGRQTALWKRARRRGESA